MKKHILISIALVWCSFINAQSFSSDTTKFTYCEIVGIEKLMSSKIVVNIDFGQETHFFSDTRYKDPSTGKPYVFNSMIDALNFMGKDSWDFVQAYTVGDAQRGYVYHYVLKKSTSLINKATLQ